MTKANWNYPTAVRFGAGRIAELPEALKVAGIKKPLLVTDAGLAALPVTQNTLALLKAAGVEAGMFADVKPNPVSANVEAGIEVRGEEDRIGILGAQRAEENELVVNIAAEDTDRSDTPGLRVFLPVFEVRSNSIHVVELGFPKRRRAFFTEHIRKNLFR